MAQRRTDERLADGLRRLLDERGLSLRALAEEIGVNQSYLSRILGAKGARPASAKIAGEIADAFGLPVDYFAEYREAIVIDAVTHDAALRDRIYDSLKARRR